MDRKFWQQDFPRRYEEIAPLYRLKNAVIVLEVRQIIDPDIAKGKAKTLGVREAAMRKLATAHDWLPGYVPHYLKPDDVERFALDLQRRPGMLRKLGSVFVETLRNIPLLVQILLYGAILASLPRVVPDQGPESERWERKEATSTSSGRLSPTAR